MAESEFERRTQSLQTQLEEQIPSNVEDLKAEKTKKSLIETIKASLGEKQDSAAGAEEDRVVEQALRRSLAKWYPLPASESEDTASKQKTSRGRKKRQQQQEENHHDDNKTIPFGLHATELLLDVAIECTQQELIQPAMPFLLLEDAVKTSSITYCSELWEYLERRRDLLTSSVYLPPGKNPPAKLALLRTANDLLRRLSQERDSVFSGRVMMFLVYGLPLSEPSGVNKAGQFNSGVANAYKVDEKNTPSRKVESERDTNMDNGDKNAEDAMDRTVDRDLYKAFWDLQFTLAYPLKAIQSTQEWNTFIENTKLIMTTFESQAADADQLEDDKNDLYYSVKYLTSPKLFNIQLNDTSLRRQVLTQILIAIRFLYDPRIKHEAVWFPSGIESQSELKDLEKRTVDLLRATSPNGNNFASAILRLMEREQFWKQWKADGCKPFEKKIPDEEYTKFDTSAPSNNPQNTQREQASGPIGLGEKKPSGPIEWSVGSTLSRDLTQSCKDFVETSTPSLDKFTSTIKDIADPNDPFSTEAEKAEEIDSLRKDKRFLWRGTRLMSEENLSSIEKITQKNFVDLVADVYDIKLPQKPQETTASVSDTAATESMHTSGAAEDTKNTNSEGQTNTEPGAPEQPREAEQSETSGVKRNRSEEIEDSQPKKQPRGE
eukprot:gb/GECG01013467.1/.p1 GENE.gb/GECG01013467.1/~~gb/GECG01013467.1/.p1  ORF type:complete len:662 (+),score=104.46 gb/GECG01013467.1/:1-1986(+)